MEQKFTHLHTHTHYSLLDGLAKIPELLDRVEELRMDSIAITDHGNMYGAIEFYQEAKKRNIKPIIGIESYISNNEMHEKRSGIDDKRFHLILLAKNNTGYKNLIQLTTLAHLEGFYYKPRIDKKTLAKYSEGLIALSGCLGAEIPQLIQKGEIDKAESTILDFKKMFGAENFYLEVQSHEAEPLQQKVNDELFKLGKKTDTPVVATCDSHYVDIKDSHVHDVLLAIQTGNKIQDEKRLSLKHLDCSISSTQQMLELFPDNPEVVENSAKIASMCNVEIEMEGYQLPHYEIPKNETLASHLRKECVDGLEKRYGVDVSKITDYEKSILDQLPKGTDEKTKQLASRLEYELGVIIKMHFEAYMLIVADIVNWAKSQNIIVGPGRGSAAGSIVAYVLSITDIDPIEYNLLFERFLNPDRISMPDIDLDFADTGRGKVIEYVSNKYGKENVAQIITFGTMASRMAIRDVGRALDYPYSFCDHVAKLIPQMSSLKSALEEVEDIKQIYETDERAKKLIDTAIRLEGVVRHTATHACGVVITKEPLVNRVPLQLSSSDENSIITQYEMHAIEKLGLLKMDFLGLTNLAIIEKALDEIEKTHNIRIDLDEISHKDTKAFELLQRGDTTGVFQLESAGMRRYLKDLKPTEFEDIIAMISLYRPGPMELLPEYIERKLGKKEIHYDHPLLEPILKNTYGIGVYQEQMMQIVQTLARFTLAEADTLRKAIGKKDAKLLKEQQEKIIKGIINNGIDAKTAKKIWDLFPPFARYGFNRSHAACYALIAYNTAYLKAHYPTEFMTALLNSETKNIDRLSFLINEADQHDIKVLPPSIQESQVRFSQVKEDEIRFGLHAIKNVSAAIVKNIIEDRNENGKFESIADFMQRIGKYDLNKKSLESLIKAGAFDELEERNYLLINIEALLKYARAQNALNNSNQASLFESIPQATPPLELENAEKTTKTERLQWEKELLGFYMSGHPLSEYKDTFKGNQTIDGAKAIANISVKIGALVSSTKKIVTKTGEPMLFFTAEDLTGNIEVVVFPRVFAQHQALLTDGKILQIQGTVDKKNGEPKLLCENIIEVA